MSASNPNDKVCTENPKVGESAAASQPADAAAVAVKEKAKREKEERRKAKELELKMKGLDVSGGKSAAKQMTKAQRRALQDEQREAKMNGTQSRAGGSGSYQHRDGSSVASISSGRESRADMASQHSALAATAAAAGKRVAKVDMTNRVVLEDKRMHLYLHLELPQHPPSSAAAMATLQTINPINTVAVEHVAGDSGAFMAGINNAAFPPGPQVIVGKAREDYVAAEAGQPVSVPASDATGEAAVAILRDAIPPFSGGPGQRKIAKPPSGVAGVEIHSKIKEVGLRMSSMEIVGSNARAEAVLVTFSKVIADYTAPPLTDISRNLTQYVTTQINFLVYQRPMCIGMGNAIRWLKLQIGKIQPGVNDEEAKAKLVDMISEYVQERITAAGAYIAEAGAYKIQDGDVILTYGASSTVERLLLDAKHKLKRRFRVIVIDPRPQSEGRGLVRRLVAAGFSDMSSRADSEDATSTPDNHNARGKGKGRNGMNGGVTYAPVTALSFLMREASKVFLGAEAFFANGAMLSRAGTAMVALAAHSYHVPVIAACETYKFSERIQLDAVVSNELDTPDALIFKTGIPDAQPVGPKSDSTLSKMEYSAYARDRYSAHPRWNNRSSLGSFASNAPAYAGKGNVARVVVPAPDEMSPEAKHAARLKEIFPLSDWRSTPNLRLLNLMQDITPSVFVTMIITEVGMIPTTSIPVVLREYKNQN
ncbi:hypothetical protein LPJ66_007753 [Kickxella alabastrina]|uniref:Uncharacterized protein n=1 Tax=Kickxella alabastrina TaxID=61397 RepID=A0ACC1I806_9FUNG|nr:hypothetical protein LPJ66_007753 [Kickxella alabastrina]